MLATIHFDNEFGSERNEVDDVRTDRCLSPEMKAVGFHFAQFHPQFYFLRRETLAKCASNFVCQGGSCEHLVRGGTPTRPAFGRPPKSELRSSRPHEGEGEVIYRGKLVVPIKNPSIARAQSRPSRIAHTTSDWPRRMSPAENTLGREV